MNKVKAWLVEHWVELAALLLALWSTWRASCSEKKAEEAKRKTEENEDELQKIKEDFDASEKYSQFKLVERLFEDALTELAVVTDKESEASKDEIKRALLMALNRYTNLYNEINSFCKLINNGSIKAEKYLKDTAYQKLKDHADLQWQFYGELNKKAKEISMPGLRRPRNEAYKAYDEFLEKHLTKYKWEDVKKKREEVGME